MPHKVPAADFDHREIGQLTSFRMRRSGHDESERAFYTWSAIKNGKEFTIWNKNDYPNSMKNLPEGVRLKAIEIANALLEDGYEDGRAIAIGISQAKEWARNHDREIRNGHTNGYSQHVVPHPDGWAVKRSNAERASFVFDTKQEAVRRARQIAGNQGVTLLIHDQKGRIQQTHSYM